MKIAEGIEMLEISVDMPEVLDEPTVIYPTLLYDTKSVILVDTGFPGILPLIKKEIEKTLPFEGINNLIITHQDIDHIGNLFSIIKELQGRVRVMSHGEEKPYIEGSKEPHKMSKLKEKTGALPPNARAVYKKIISAFQNSTAQVDKTLKDNEVLPFLGGIRVIFTPGHTAGHICLYAEESKTLIAGDALNVKEGNLVVPHESANYNSEMSKRSLKKLTKLDVEKVICYHGGYFQGDANTRIKELASG